MSAPARSGPPTSAFVGLTIAVLGLALALIATMGALREERVARARLAAEVDSLRGALKETRDSTYVDAYIHRDSIAHWNDVIKKLRASGLVDPITDLRADLARHPELIPMRGVLGEKQGFYSLDRIQVLNDRWAFASFEDGHVGGEMLLEYQVQKGRIQWRVVSWRPVP